MLIIIGRGFFKIKTNVSICVINLHIGNHNIVTYTTFYHKTGHWCVYLSNCIQACRSRGCRGCHCNPRFCQINWPYCNKGGGRLGPPHYYWPPRFSVLPMALHYLCGSIYTFKQRNTTYDKNKLPKYILERTSNSMSLFYIAYKSIWLNKCCEWQLTCHLITSIFI